MITLGGPLAGAVFSASMAFRYQLWRRANPGQPTILWVLLNPSTADHQQLDPTLRRCRAYSYAWGFQNWEVCNLFAFRATKPAAMKAALDPVGPANDDMILDAARRASQVMVGWGVHGPHLGRDRAVLQLLKDAGRQPWCLKVVGTGQPAHPLYLPARAMARAFAPNGGGGGEDGTV